MSLHSLSWAMQQRGLKPTEKLILLVLADHADNSGTCFPSMNRIAEIVGIKRRSIAKNMAILEDHGLMQRVPRTRPDGSLTSNAFVLSVGDVPQDMTSGHIEQDMNPSNIASSETIVSDKALLDGEWDDFKASYPKRLGSQDWTRASRYWKRMPPDDRVAAVIGAKAYRSYIAQQEKENTEYVKMASTFLSPAGKAWREWSEHKISYVDHKKSDGYTRLPPQETV